MELILNANSADISASDFILEKHDTQTNRRIDFLGHSAINMSN